MKYQRIAILAEGRFGVITSKTATCAVRYIPERVVCVIDSTKSGKKVHDVLGFGGDIPIVRDLKEALSYSPDSLLIGIAPRGGVLPQEWRQIVLESIENNLNILSGLHTMLSEDGEIAKAASSKGVSIWDIRKPEVPSEVAKATLRWKRGKVLLTVGSDCSSGKMTVALEIARYLQSKGIRAEFVPTGQTGILLAGWGQAVDRVPGDFMSAVIENLTTQALSTGEVAIVEGQGSLIHPAYSGVTLAIIHGCCPDAMVLCHQPTRKEIEGYSIQIPALKELVKIYEWAAGLVHQSRVIAIALNTFDMDERESLSVVEAVEKETGLPTTDVIRWGCDRIAKALEAI